MGGGTADPPATPLDLSGAEGCGLATCASLGASCGPIGDGCGNVVDCGACPFPQTCGGGGVRYECGGTNACTPLTCASLALSCGTTSDGCGHTLNCYPDGATSCPKPGDTCGGSGVNGTCGTAPTGGGVTCTPRTCTELGYTCGTTSDGCGATLNCYPGGGVSCPNAGETCGGGGVQFQCGKVAACTPITSCGTRNCGMIGNGCGGTINCATMTPQCPAGQTCGGGGTPNVCGPPACVPKTITSCGTTCGYINDGCGGSVNCSMVTPCTAPATCGGTGMPGVCGAPACAPKTCAMLGANCGWAGDGCGNLICCGTLTGGVCSTTCPSGQLCGSLQPNQCGNNKAGTNGMCMPGVNTTITGKVVAPTDAGAGFGNPDPIFNATVFVPSGAIQAITTGATCNTCAASQPAIVSTTTAIDGTFTLVNPPTGANVQVVIQLGKWRRVLTLTVTPCVNNSLTLAQTRFPRRQAEFGVYDNIPRFAVSTGNVDVMECVLRKMGIADAEFAAGDTGAGVPATGRVHVYKASFNASAGSSGAVLGSVAATPSDDKLWGNTTTLNAYDAVLFPCTGGQDNKTVAGQSNLVDYANKGGRVFSTHYSYVWLFNNTQLGAATPKATATWQSTASWAINGTASDVYSNGLIDVSFPKGNNLSQWLQNTVPPAPVVLSADMTNVQNTANASAVTNFPTAGTLIIDQEQVVYTSISGTQFRGLIRGANGTAAVTHATNAKVSLWAQIPVNVLRNDFNLPLANGGQRWMSVQNAAPGNGPGNFPIHYTFNTPVGLPAANQCGRVVFSDFHVENSATSKNVVFPAECSGSTPMTAQEKLLEFMLFDLTSCVAPDVPTCTPKTCNNIGAAAYVCGQWGDGCGGTLSCGTCPAGTCGGDGVPGQCAAPKCVAKTCAMLGTNVCGSYSDGCGGALNCTCDAGTGATCVSGQCVAPCTPLTCNQLGYSCGSWSDGCGGVVNCSNCMAPKTCSGGGVPGQCGGCVPLTCSQLGLSCGNSGDGCGGTLTCGSCNAPQTCGGGGVAGQCGNGGVTCKPLTCQQFGLSCGSIGDGCGSLLQCGACPVGQVCGGSGTNGQCGATGCTPYTCSTVPGGPADCGTVGDGCGGTLSCGTCAAPRTCGGAGRANQCGVVG